MRLGAVGLLLFLITRFVYAQPSGNKCEQAGSLVSLIEKNHLQPLPVNDEWSRRVFSNLFDALDPLHLYFTQEDLHTFITQQHQLDDLVKEKKQCAWINAVRAFSKNVQATTRYGSGKPSANHLIIRNPISLIWPTSLRKILLHQRNSLKCNARHTLSFRF